MERLPTGDPLWDVAFDDKGRLTRPAAGDLLDQVVAEGVADLFVMSHGWGTSEQNARSLYGAMFPMIRSAAAGVAALGPLGFAGVLWPSLWFPPTRATVPAPGGSTQSGDGAVVDVSAGTSAVSGKEIADSLSPGFTDPAQQRAVVEIGELIDRGHAMVGTAASDEAKHGLLAEIQERFSSLLPPAPDGEFEDSGETALLLTSDPATDYRATAEAFGSAPPGSSTQGLGDWFAHAVDGAKDAVRVLSYSVMKTRAGDIGRLGLGPLLAALHRRAPGVRVHLIGHSFGARLVSFALAGTGSPAESPVSSLLLLQGAFSHWSFAQAKDNPFGSAGALHGFADRVHGPCVATFTMFDWAVGIWYPRASFLARQDAQAAAAGRWGGMGADGFQAVTPLEDRTMPVQGGRDYGFSAGRFYRVDGVNVINRTDGDPFGGAHSDIRKAPVADLVVAAAAARA